MQSKIIVGVIAIAVWTAANLSLANDESGVGHKQIGQFSGFEGNETVLGEAVVSAIHEAAKANGL